MRLHRAINGLVRAFKFATRFAAWRVRGSGRGGAGRNIWGLNRRQVDLLRQKRCVPGTGQWHRWYKANRKRQRQCTAMRRLGYRIADPRYIDLPRYMVR